MATTGGAETSPLRRPLFRAMWGAAVVTNVGTWINEVGAAWLMTSLAPSPIMIALVQTAATVPVLVLALPAGALADVFDRRKVLLFAQLWMAASALALGLLTVAGLTTAPLLLALTFSLGIGTALTGPAWQASVPELVPREELPAALALNSAAVNAARAVGPALGGVIVAASGPGAAFLVNAASFAVVITVVFRWRREQEPHTLPPERIGSALGLGARYVRHNASLVAVLVRAFAFIVFGGALWALLPLVAREQLRVGAVGYGGLLGALGVGALATTFLLGALRRRLSPDRLVTASTVLYAGVVALTGATGAYALLVPVLFVGGGAWVALLSSFQSGVQLSVPAWIRGRALAAYLMVFFGGQAAGALVWGGVAEAIGIRYTLWITAAGLLAGTALVRRFPLGAIGSLNLDPAHSWPSLDALAVDAAEREDRPVLVSIRYRVEPARAAEFRAAMRALEDARRRGGSVRWGAVPRSRRTHAVRRAVRRPVLDRPPPPPRARDRSRPRHPGRRARLPRPRRRSRRRAPARVPALTAAPWDSGREDAWFGARYAERGTERSNYCG